MIVNNEDRGLLTPGHAGQKTVSVPSIASFEP